MTRIYSAVLSQLPVLGRVMIALVCSLTFAHTVMIAATVNNKAISTQDLNNRIKMAIISSGMPDTPATHSQLRDQILEMMINEQIQLQLGKEFDIKIDDAAIMASVHEIESQNNMPSGGLAKMLEQKGIPFSVMKKHLEATILWRDYIRERFRNLVQVSDSDVDRALQELKSSTNEPRYHLAEIVLYFDGPQGAGKARSEANRIVAQLKAGGRFSMLAGQFSQAPSAARGGDIGWVPVSKMDPAVAPHIKNLGVNSISEPIQTDKEYRIYFVRDRLDAGQFARPTTTVTFKQVSINIPANAFPFEVEASLKQMASMAKQVTNCRMVDSLVSRKNATVQEAKDIPIENMPPELRNLMEKAGVNRATQPVYTGKSGVFFVMCAKKTTNPKEPSRDEVRAQLVDRKLQSVAAQELRTRRGGAHIDIRND